MQFVLQSEHKMNNHEGTEYVRSVLQQKYWIIGLRNAPRRIKCNGLLCHKRNIQTLRPLMADLPLQKVEDRIHLSSNTGIDNFGLFGVKLLKNYEKVALLLHLLEHESYAYRNCTFIRRGVLPCCYFLICRSQRNNCSNFVGAAKEIKQFIDNLHTQDIAVYLRQKEIKWTMNPPGAPHFGGVWERLVKSCKRAMVAVLVGRSISDEVLTPTMCLVEQSLNGRPLTAASNDPEESLTSIRFLLGRSSSYDQVVMM